MGSAIRNPQINDRKVASELNMSFKVLTSIKISVSFLICIPEQLSKKFVIKIRHIKTKMGGI
jgi:hypothetical protein